MLRPLFAVFVFLASLVSVQAQAPKTGPTVWMSPPGQDKGKAFRELFERPEEWKETRALVDVLFCTDLGFQSNFKDDAELTRWFAQARDWKLKLAMEVGAIKEWGKNGGGVLCQGTEKLGAPAKAGGQYLRGGDG
ncbi:MAG: hypothetical protein WDN28_05410 [Chthoniobacter sp.]